jgi:DMSO/TMAO reductase YedYZ molybdopterin-dependent catalytic subunit
LTVPPPGRRRARTGIDRRTGVDGSRRRLLWQGGAVFGGLLLGGCDGLTESPSVTRVLESAERLNYATQRLLLGRHSLAREFTEADLSPVFRSNGTSRPGTEEYQRLMAGGFTEWRLAVGGLVANPMQLTLDSLRAMPARTQITRHDCVEGWSAIGRWTGVPLATILRSARMLPSARFIVFHCADQLERGAPYYESIDLDDAFHPQTILAYDLNGRALPVANGAPLRLRVERQLGYKQAKYLMGLEAVERFDTIRGGKGGFWEDRGYAWYAGI